MAAKFVIPAAVLLILLQHSCSAFISTASHTHTISHVQLAKRSSFGGSFACSAPRPLHMHIHRTTQRRVPHLLLRMNLFDGLVAKIADVTREVTVQHILVEKEQEAIEIRKKLAKEKNLVQKFGEYAAQYSTCGSAKKTPDAKLAQLRGDPGEMKFRKGQTDPNFERAAFETAPVGKVHGPVKTQFGYHLMLVRNRPEK